MADCVTEGIRTLSSNLAGAPNSALQCVQISARGSDAHYESSDTRASFVLTCLALASTAVLVAAQKTDQNGKDNPKQLEAKRPKISLRAQPPVGVAPFRVVLTGELQGGADDFEEVYCPTVEWVWGDAHDVRVDARLRAVRSGQEPDQATLHDRTHVSREGAYKVYIHLKRKDKLVASASIDDSGSAGRSRRRTVTLVESESSLALPSVVAEESDLGLSVDKSHNQMNALGIRSLPRDRSPTERLRMRVGVIEPDDLQAPETVPFGEPRCGRADRSESELGLGEVAGRERPR